MGTDDLRDRPRTREEGRGFGRVVTEQPALWCRRGEPPTMLTLHRHDDLEVNIVLRGELRYLYAGRPLVLREGQIAMFWATQPHGLVQERTEADAAGETCWVHVPFATVLSWGLAEADMQRLMQAMPLVTDEPALRERLAAMVSTWLEEIGDRATEGIALLEIQAAVRRILRADPVPWPFTDGATPSPEAAPEAAHEAPEPDGAHSRMAGRAGDAGHALRMAQFVVDRFRGEVSVGDVARSVHLTPSHAMTVFRRAVGVTIGEYVTMCRVAEAQRLLLTSRLSSTQIAEAAGFGSLSSYYAHVRRACGMTPREYRRQVEV
ncbi:helix-turn-helix domain-containing protein [Ruania halotolerans]|uniref:helix-turn-helix domain-containing protein n=1 Tax=Ruania halotolerans TaxID=2897773 RepID=UPI001E45E84E|nr:helix-turn-helix domain-containing protein [Ruania halotolerans]UFU07965.1 helix-turn-helix domain-containing protein [Ruania halotolerans]